MLQAWKTQVGDKNNVLWVAVSNWLLAGNFKEKSAIASTLLALGKKRFYLKSLG